MNEETEEQDKPLAIRKAAPTRQPSALAIMAERLAVDPGKLLATLKGSVFPGASDSELLALVAISNRYQLDPILRQIYGMPKKGGGIAPVVSVDGWLSIVNSHPQMDGMSFEEHEDGHGELIATTCTIWRKDRSHPITVTEWLEECERKTEPWKMKRRMMRHKALKECARYAFGIAGVMDEDEARDMGATQPKTQIAIDPFDKSQLPPSLRPAEAEVIEPEVEPEIEADETPSPGLF